MYTILVTIPIKSIIADVVFVIAIPTGICGLVLIFKDWLYRKKHDKDLKNFKD